MLSSDAMSALTDAIPSLSESEQNSLLGELCSAGSTDGPTGWNVSLWRAARITDRLCD
jgi:hypothetical protein